MRIEFNAKFEKNNKGIDELFKLLARKGRINFELKKGKVIIEDFSSDKIDSILLIIRENFDITSLDLNNEKKLKIRNDEKALQISKKKIKEEIKEKPDSIKSKVRAAIFKFKVFTLTQLRETLSDTDFGTIRSYVNDMKKDNIIVEIERGKYAVR